MVSYTNTPNWANKEVVDKEMFASFGSALPIPTQIVVTMSNEFKANFIWIGVILFLITYLGARQLPPKFFKLAFFMTESY